MTIEEKSIKNNRELLQLAEQLGEISQPRYA